MKLTLIGIGTGNIDHLTLQAIKAINAQDVIMIPRKGADKADLAELRMRICDEVLNHDTVRIVEFDLPSRDPETQDYQQRVDDWHNAIAAVWTETMQAQFGAEHFGLLVWGDPSLYDSSLRIAERLVPRPEIEVIPGITSLQALTAAHAIPLNDVGAPVTITTGRRLRDEGWPAGVNKIAVMLDGDCSFQTQPAEGMYIWWCAYAGMPNQIAIAGPLAEVSDQIVKRRAEARGAHGWIMDIYLLRRD